MDFFSRKPQGEPLNVWFCFDKSDSFSGDPEKSKKLSTDFVKGMRHAGLQADFDKLHLIFFDAKNLVSFPLDTYTEDALIEKVENLLVPEPTAWGTPVGEVLQYLTKQIQQSPNYRHIVLMATDLADEPLKPDDPNYQAKSNLTKEIVRAFEMATEQTTESVIFSWIKAENVQKINEMFSQKYIDNKIIIVTDLNESVAPNGRSITFYDKLTQSVEKARINSQKGAKKND